MQNSFNIFLKGEEKNKIKYSLKDKSDEEIKEFCKYLIADEYLDAEIDSVAFKDLITENAFNLKFYVKITELLQKQNNLYFLNYDPVKSSNYKWLAETERKYPLHFFYPGTQKKIITISFPENLKIEASPQALNIDSKSINFLESVNTEFPNKIIISKRLDLKDIHFPIKYYANIREIFKSIQKKDKEQLVFKRKK